MEKSRIINESCNYAHSDQFTEAFSCNKSFDRDACSPRHGKTRHTDERDNVQDNSTHSLSLKASRWLGSAAHMK